VGSTTYTIKTSNTKLLGSSLLLVVCHLAAFGPFCYVFIFHPPGSTARGKEATSSVPVLSLFHLSVLEYFFNPTLFTARYRCIPRSPGDMEGFEVTQVHLLAQFTSGFSDMLRYTTTTTTIIITAPREMFCIQVLRMISKKEKIKKNAPHSTLN